jgi:hypothetical protein
MAPQRCHDCPRTDTVPCEGSGIPCDKRHYLCPDHLYAGSPIPPDQMFTDGTSRHPMCIECWSVYDGGVRA